MTLGLDSRPGLRRGVKLADDPVRGRQALLYPEGVLLLNETAAAVLQHCDGQRTVPEVAGRLAEEYDDVSAQDVLDLLADLDARRLLACDGTGRPAQPFAPSIPVDVVRSPVPLGMLAEVTDRCPLHCGYCSNPVNLTAYADMVTAKTTTERAERIRVFIRGPLILRSGAPQNDESGTKCV